MIVYILLESTSYSDDEFCGVFATEKQAQARLDEIIKEIPRQKDSLCIEKYEISK